MTTAVVPRKAGPFAGDGVTVLFPFAYKIFATTDVVVTKTSTAGVETVLAITADYTVAMNADQNVSPGGSVTALVVPAVNEKITLSSSVPESQGTSLPQGGQWSAKVVESALDKATILVGQLRESLTRTLTYAISDTSTGKSLPTKTARSNNFLAFDGNGDPIAATGLASSPVSAAMAPVVSAATTDAGLTQLGFSTFFKTLIGAATAAALRVLVGAAQTVITTKGDIYVGGAAGAETRLPVGANGAISMARSASATGLAYVAALNKEINGFTYANNGTDSIDIAAGGAMDATNAYWLAGAALTKNITTAWAVGTAVGLLDTGAVGNNDYYLWAIARSDTGVVDYLGSLSSTAPTMPANYDFKRLIGWFKRVGGANVAFHTYETEGGGIEMNWDSPTLDVNLANTLTTARRTDAVKVPQNFSTIAHMNIIVNDASAGFDVWIYCPDQTDLAPSSSAAPLGNFHHSTGSLISLQLRLRTSATGTIAARSGLATIDQYAVSTMGFTWARRN